MDTVNPKPNPTLNVNEWSDSQVKALIHDLDKTPDAEEIRHVNFLPGIWGCPKIVE